MAEIRPFKALRYNLEKAGSIQELTCPPYDIVSEEQRQQYLGRNGYNVNRLELPKEGGKPLPGGRPHLKPLALRGCAPAGHGGRLLPL